jgi:acyl carrier protein
LCDLVVAASDRRYGMNFTELGLTPGVGTTRIVTDLVGYHLAAELLFAGRFHRGDELARRGLFNVAVDSADVLSSAFDLARQISTKPRKVLEMTKAAMALGRRTALLEAMSREHLMHQVCHNLPETVASIESNYLQVVLKHIRKNVIGLDGKTIDTSRSMLEMGASSLDVVEIVSASMRELKIKIARTRLASLNNIDELVDLFYEVKQSAG